MEQPVRIQPEQVLLIPEHCLAKRPVEQAHVAKLERVSLGWNFILDFDLGTWLRLQRL
jgi:hypothetical protein